MFQNARSDLKIGCHLTALSLNEPISLQRLLAVRLTVRLCVDVRDFVDRRRRRLFGWWPLIDAARLLVLVIRSKKFRLEEPTRHHNGRFASIADVTAAALN